VVFLAWAISGLAGGIDDKFSTVRCENLSGFCLDFARFFFCLHFVLADPIVIK